MLVMLPRPHQPARSTATPTRYYCLSLQRHGYSVKQRLFEFNVYPHKPNSVPSWSVPLYSLIGPVVLFIVYGAISRRPAMEIFRLIRVFVLAVRRRACTALACARAAA